MPKVLYKYEARAVLQIGVPGNELQVAATIHTLEHSYTTDGVGAGDDELVSTGIHRAKGHAADLLEPREHLRDQVQLTALGSRLLAVAHVAHVAAAATRRDTILLGGASVGGAIGEFEDRDGVTALIGDVGAGVAVANVDEGVGELLGGGGDEYFGGKERRARKGVGRDDRDVGDER